MSDRSLWTSTFKGFCNAGEAVVAAWLLDQWFARPYTFGDLRRVLGFVAAAGIAAATSAFGGAATMTMFHTAAPFWEVWRAWFLSDGVGIVVVAPLIIGLGHMWRDQPSRGEWIEGVGVLALLALSSFYVVTPPTGSWLSFSPGAVVLPLLWWLTARCQPAFGIAGAFVASITVLWATTFGVGHFGDASVSLMERVNGARVVITMVTVCTLVLAALFAERRRNEATLRDSNNRLRLALSAEEESKARLADAMAAGQVMAFEWDVITGLSQRDNAPHILGFGGGRSPCDDFFSRVHVDDCERLKKHVRELHPGNPTYALTFRFVRSDGRQVWLEETAKGEFDATGRLLRIKGLTRDITERKLAELALAERNLQFALAGRASLVGSYAYDTDTEMLQVSEGYASIHGFPEGTTKIARNQWLAGVHPEDVELLERCRGQAFRQQQVEYSVDYRILLPSREERWIEARTFISYDGDGRPQRAAGVIIDVTKRRQTEKALTDRNKQLELAGRVGLVGSFAIDVNTAQEDVTSQSMQVSPGFAAIYGLSESIAEISVGDWRSRIHPDDLPQFLASRYQAFAEQCAEHHAEYRIVRSSGVIRWVETRCSIEYDQDGHARRVVGVNIDITERKQAEEHRNILNAELDHRVKNVLATVCSIIFQAQRANASAADFVASVDHRIKSLASTHELLSHSRWHGVSLAELIWREFAPYSTGNTEISGPSITLKPEAAQATAMVLHELATNAAKYGALSNHSGRVSVRWFWLPNGTPRHRLAIDWQEIGGPPVSAPSASGYGTSIIRELIPYELEGTVDLVFAPSGVKCRLEVPARCVSSDRRSKTSASTNASLH